MDHGYTTNVGIISRNTATAPLQEVAAFVFLTQEESTVPFYQLLSAAASDHFYTMSETEKSAALAAGYVVSADPPTFIYPTQVCGSTPFYRLYSETGKDNFYTTSESERLEFITNGYADIEIAGYVLPTTAAQCAFS